MEIEKVSSTPLDLSTTLRMLAKKRIIQLEPPVTTLNVKEWAAITNAFFQKQCDLIAGVYFGRFGMIERLSSKDSREESEESLTMADIRFLIHPEEPTPRWMYEFGYPVEM